MGRTVQPYSQQVQIVEERFKGFRRALRKEDQVILDRLLLTAKKQLQSGVMSASPNPFDSMALSMLIDLQKQIEKLSQEVESLKPDQVSQ
jgi:hypothetical protein